MMLSATLAFRSAALFALLAATANAEPPTVGESRTIEQKPLRALFDAADFVAFVFPRKLEQIEGGARAELVTTRLFKGEIEKELVVSWATGESGRYPRALGRSYLALMRNKVGVSRDVAFLEHEPITIDPIPGITDRCRSAGAKVSCDVFKLLRGQNVGVIFDKTIVRRVVTYVFGAKGAQPLELDVVFVDDIERTFCTWTDCRRFRPMDVPVVDPNVRKG